MANTDKDVLLNPKILFPYLDKFAHKDIFDNISFAWEAVPKIANYLKSQFKCLNSGLIVEGNDGFKLIDPKLAFPYVYFDFAAGSVQIGKGTAIEPHSYIIGPAIMGKNCRIRFLSYIRGNVIIGDNCVIGNKTEIKNSIIMNHSNVPHANYIGDSIIGSNVNIGWMSGFLNFRADKNYIWIKIINKEGNLLFKEQISLKKLGSIIGDDSSIGADIHLNPGFILMPATRIISKRNLAKELLWI